MGACMRGQGAPCCATDRSRGMKGTYMKRTDMKGTDMKKSELATGDDAEREGPALPEKGAMVDEHGRATGVPSRTGTGSSAPPVDTERVEKASQTHRP